jgi:hypothetical protein
MCKNWEVKGSDSIRRMETYNMVNNNVLLYGCSTVGYSTTFPLLGRNPLAKGHIEQPSATDCVRRVIALQLFI